MRGLQSLRGKVLFLTKRSCFESKNPGYRSATSRLLQLDVSLMPALRAKASGQSLLRFIKLDTSFVPQVLHSNFSYRHVIIKWGERLVFITTVRRQPKLCVSQPRRENTYMQLHARASTQVHAASTYCPTEIHPPHCLYSPVYTNTNIHASMYTCQLRHSCKSTVAQALKCTCRHRAEQTCTHFRGLPSTGSGVGSP